MPAAVSPERPQNGLTKFTNCRILCGDDLVQGDVWVSSSTGKIVKSQAAFFDGLVLPDEIIDLGGRILAPGMIECQLNGAFGFNYSTQLDDMSEYGKKLREVNKLLAKTGVTSYLPTLTSQQAELYQKALPYLRPMGHKHEPEDGAESLGAHCEGPFLNPTKNGVHDVRVMLEAETFADLEACYGSENINPRFEGDAIPIRMITAAPERGNMMKVIPDIVCRGICFSVGHTEATFEEAAEAVDQGATMITHLFNAMRPLHHRNPGVFGVLGETESQPHPYYGVISDGIHLHPSTVKIAYNAHPEGFVLVTDAMHLLGMPDGAYPWTNGESTCTIVKQGGKLLLGDSDTIAGSSTTLIECVNRFLDFSGAGIPQALKAVTSTPAALLGLQGVKGTLDAGADADLIVLSDEKTENGGTLLHVDEVWKFGRKLECN